MAISTIARGQITIVDYNDAISLNAYIGSNQALTQIFTADTNSYTPDWTTGTFLKLTPQLFKSGSGTDLMTAGTGVKSVTWTSNGTAVTLDSTHIKNGSAPWDLTIKVNELASVTQKNYECTIVYTDPNTNLDITAKSAITFTKSINSGSLITAVGYTPNGSVFKNNGVASLTAHCDLWRGASIDSTNVTYKWFKQTANVFAPTTSTAGGTISTNTVTLTSVTNINIGSKIIVGTEPVKTVTAVNTGTKVVTVDSNFSATQTVGCTVSDPRYDAVAGANWSIINSTYTYSGITGYTTNEITIPSATVLNFETFKCAITDTDSSSPTYNQTVIDVLSFADTSDPISVDISASNGTVLRNGTGTTVLTCNLWQAGAKIDTGGTGYNYYWTAFDQTGTQITTNLTGSGGNNWSATNDSVANSVKSKTLTVADADVSGKSTFQVIINTLS
jgi:hypothetical protein